MMLDFSPRKFADVWPTANPPRKEQMVLAKVTNGRKSGSGVSKTAKDLPKSGLYLQIRIKHNPIAFGVTQPNGGPNIFTSQNPL